MLIVADSAVLHEFQVGVPGQPPQTVAKVVFIGGEDSVRAYGRLALETAAGAADAANGAMADVSKWIRLFNRLEKAVSRHHDAKAGTGFADDADDALHHAWRKVLEAAGPGRDAIVERQIAGALRSTIDAHGPVTKERIGSAAKRIRTQLEASGG